MGVDPGQHPFLRLLPQFEIDGLDQVRAGHVDQAVPKHVGAEQHLAVPALELAQVKPCAGQLQHLAVERADLLERNEHLAAADSRDHADDQRVIGATQPHDDVGELADRLSLLVRDRPADQVGQVQHAPVACFRRRRRRC